MNYSPTLHAIDQRVYDSMIVINGWQSIWRHFLRNIYFLAIMKNNRTLNENDFYKKKKNGKESLKPRRVRLIIHNGTKKTINPIFHFPLFIPIWTDGCHKRV